MALNPSAGSDDNSKCFGLRLDIMWSRNTPLMMIIGLRAEGVERPECLCGRPSKVQVQVATCQVEARRKGADAVAAF